MDLRHFHPSDEQIEAATQLLRYQPFILDEDRHTGVAYSWLYNADPTKASPDDFLFDRRSITQDVWNKAYDANRRLASLYDKLVERIVQNCPPDGSYLDVGCNTGYFPVRASLAGIRTAVGLDPADQAPTFQLLNQITGSSARFVAGQYDSASHTLETQENFGPQSFDVVSSCALLCHVSDPLHFLKAIAQLASKALLLWSGFMESDELLIRYNPPDKFCACDFPNGFDDGTSISRGLLLLTMSKLGFANWEEVTPEPDGLPENWTSQRLPQYQNFRAFLFHR
jgi:SAM-dependent methyltransferase